MRATLASIPLDKNQLLVRQPHLVKQLQLLSLKRGARRPPRVESDTTVPQAVSLGDRTLNGQLNVFGWRFRLLNG